MRRQRLGQAAAAGALVLAAVVHVPEVLAFPYRATIGRHVIHSEQPITFSLSAIVERADARLETLPGGEEAFGRRIFLTEGGWRWRLLSLRSAGAFAISRPLGEAIVINRSDQLLDRVWNGRTVGGEQRLSAVLAHEMTHALIRSRYGFVSDLRYPAWMIEGYCDFVAGAGSLSAADVAALRRSGTEHPGLIYYEGRRRVARRLRTPAASPDLLFRTP